MNIVDRNNISTLRQSARQRASAEIAEAKFGSSCPLRFTNATYIGKKSAFSQEMRMNRYLMSKSSLNNIRNIDDYSSTVNEVIFKKAAQLFPFRKYQPKKKEKI